MEGILPEELKTTSTNSPSAYIREGLLLSKGFLRLRFGGLFLGGLLFWGGGGAHYRNSTVCIGYMAGVETEFKREKS